jgi:hypothetical protein
MAKESEIKKYEINEYDEQDASYSCPDILADLVGFCICLPLLLPSIIFLLASVFHPPDNGRRRDKS